MSDFDVLQVWCQKQAAVIRMSLNSSNSQLFHEVYIRKVFQEKICDLRRRKTFNTYQASVRAKA